VDLVGHQAVLEAMFPPSTAPARLVIDPEVVGTFLFRQRFSHAVQIRPKGKS
jgi:hypothetical protein